MNKRQIGANKEKLAAEYLESIGLKVIDRNYHTRYEEIDIVAKDEKTYVFVEVKYRNSDRYGSPLEAVNANKMRKISMGAVAYMNNHKLPIDNTPIRFDVIGICGKDITYVKNAFDYTGINIM
ncbi:MAG: YraN family protein [Lachnospiraceae bacterium]|nr:YraN family protein [Lachnospiraceae bacterium]